MVCSRDYSGSSCPLRTFALENMGLSAYHASTAALRISPPWLLKAHRVQTLHLTNMVFPSLHNTRQLCTQRDAEANPSFGGGGGGALPSVPAQSSGAWCSENLLCVPIPRDPTPQDQELTLATSRSVLLLTSSPGKEMTTGVFLAWSGTAQVQWRASSPTRKGASGAGPILAGLWNEREQRFSPMKNCPRLCLWSCWACS